MKLQHEIEKRQPFDSPAEEVLLNLMRTADVLVRPFDELFKSAGLSSTQYNVLRILRGAGAQGLACGQIAARMITRDPDLTRLLDRLEAPGLVARERSGSDRRVVTARITPAGLELLERLDLPVRRLHEQQLAHMGHDDLHALSKLLENARNKEQT
jgi:DNA-binding MarR family transcriptional regulator